MRIGRLLTFALALVLPGAGSAAAQDSHKVGITMGYPSAFGLHWRISDTVAVRPELTLSGSSSAATSNSFTGDSDTTNIGVSVGVVFYMGSYDHVRTYFSPRFTYAHATSENTTSSVTTSTVKSTADAVGGSGSFGAQYNPTDRFSVFGEFGFSVAHTTTEAGFSPTKVTGNSWGTRTAVGVIFYF